LGKTFDRSILTGGLLVFIRFIAPANTIANDLYQQDKNTVDIETPVFALDSSKIDLCLSLFPWSSFRSTKAAVKLHILLNIKGNIPDFI